jgi:uncharacterized membrane protein
LGYVASDTPSLLPRPWYFQGLIGGISALIFFVIGLVLNALGRLFARWSGFRMSIRPEARHVLGQIWHVVLFLALLTYPLLNQTWHDSVAAYVGEPPPTSLYPFLAVLTAAVVLAVFLGIWYLLNRLQQWLTSRIKRRIVRVALARTVATVLTIAVVAAILDQVIIRGFLVAATSQADELNAVTPSRAFVPMSSLRSGGPGSLVPWDSLGADAKSFVFSGPSRERIRSVTGDQGALDPIRIDAAGNKQRDLAAAKDLILAEMDRTHAFERKAVLVLTSTSTGFTNEWAAESFEYLMRGNTAIITMQYSALPSALGLLTAKQEPPEVGRLLLDAVAARIAELPPDRRPQIYAGGESLGAYGGNGAFSSPEDMLAKVNGALWTGTPSFTPLWRTLADERSFGSTVVNPTISGGEHIRFASNAAELTQDQFGHRYGAWQAPRVVYLQHETDPVVWWSTDLILSAPPWLDETTAPNSPMSRMSWMPFVTFWQLTGDMAMSNTVSGGFGHRYQETETVSAWAGVLGMDPHGDYSRIERAIAVANAE